MSDVEYYQGEIQSLAKSLAKSRANEKQLREALIDMVYQFAHWSDHVGGFCSGGLSALEDAFEALGCDDPYLVPELWCGVGGCKRQIAAGTNTPEGYKRTCVKHIPTLEVKQ